MGPQLKLWIWCIIMTTLISLPLVFSRCLGVDISVSIYPGGMTYILYGEPLELFCTIDRGTAYDLEFMFGGANIESEVVNSTTRRLYIEHPDKGVYTYHCSNKVNHKYCTKRVIVELPPADVTDFSCVSKNVEELSCTWTSGERIYSRRNYTVIINGFHPYCNAIRGDKNMWFCYWNTNSQPRYKQYVDNSNFQLTGCNHFGCNRQTFNVNHFAIVKPNPPQYLRVVRNNAHSVLLQWDIPNNIVVFFPCPVVHKIEYETNKMGNIYSVDATNLPPKNKTYKYLLSNLPYAHMSYEVKISIKSALDIDGKFWSDNVLRIFTTASEIPQRPPNTTAGAFEQSIFENKRIINIYWQQLEEYEEAGDNFTYLVVARQESKNPETLYPNKDTSLSYVTLKDASLGAIHISIWSTNVNGSSTNSTDLYIPSKDDTEGLRVSSFTKISYENGTYKLSWISVNNIDNYTLFWCQQNIPRICIGRLNFTILDSNKDTHMIDLPRDNRYQFAISANKGSKSSGMTWVSCDISELTMSMYDFPINLHYSVAGKSFVKIMWTSPCILQDYITGYLITYCAVINTSNICDTNFENKSVIYINDSKQMETDITNLKPFTTYRFNLALNTTYGLKSNENAVTVVTTLEDT